MVVLTEEQSLKTHVIPSRGVTCVMCGQRAGPGNITAGSLYTDGRQAFACTIHLLRDRRRWIVFWAAFDNDQRASSKQKVSR